MGPAAFARKKQKDLYGKMRVKEARSNNDLICQARVSGTVIGSSFVLFHVSMEMTLGQFRSREKRLHTKTSLPVGKRC